MKEAAELAESTQILLNVSEFTDVSAATDSLISTVQAFKYTAEESMGVVDVLNTIGNNYAISTADLAQSLTKSSSALVAANGTLEEAVALTAAANTTIQDADVVGTALKTISMRLRGTSLSEMEEDGLETEGYTTQSKLRGTVKSVTGIDILTDTGAYKSTYQILAEIAEVWDDITDDKARAGLLEALAGKRSGSVVAAILQNPDVLKDAFESAKGAQGSAQAELEKYMDSIQGRLDQFTNSLQTMWNNVLDDDLVKFIVQAGTELLKFIDNLGVVKTLIIGIGTYLIQKNFKGDLFGGLFNAQSIDEAKDRLKNLKAEIATLQGKKPSKRNDRKITRKQNQANTLGASIKEYDELSEKLKKLRVDQDGAKKALDNYNKKLANKAEKGRKITDAEIAKQTELNTKYNESKLAVEDTEKALLQAEVQAKATGIAGRNAGASIKTWFTSAGKAVWKFAKEMAMSMAYTMAFTAIFEAIGNIGNALAPIFKNMDKSAEALQEKLSELENELSSVESELNSLQSELKDTDERIEELMSQGTLTFVEQEELNKLKSVSAELKAQIELQENLRKSMQQGVNSASVDATNAYLDTSFMSERSKTERQEEAKEIGSGIGQIAGTIIGGIVGTVIGGGIALASGGTAAVPGAAIGIAAGSAIAGWFGGEVGSAVAGSSYDSEQSVEEAMNSMLETRAKLKEEQDKALSKNDAEAYNEATEALRTYDSQMAKHISQIQQNYNAMDWELADPETRKQMMEYADWLDKYNISMGTDGAKSNAIARIFGDEAEGGFAKAKKEIDALKKNLTEAQNSGEGVDEALAALEGFELNLSEEEVERLRSMGIYLYEVEDYFKNVVKTESEFIESDLEDVAKDINKITDGLGSLKSAFEEVIEEGVLTAKTVMALKEELELSKYSDVEGVTDAWREYLDVMMSGAATTEEMTIATEKLAQSIIEAALETNSLTSDNKFEYVVQLQSLGVTNAEEYVNDMLQKNMTKDLEGKVSTAYQEALKAAFAQNTYTPTDLVDEVFGNLSDTDLAKLAAEYNIVGQLSTDTITEMAEAYGVTEDAIQGIIEKLNEQQRLEADIAKYRESQDKYRDFEANWNRKLQDWRALQKSITDTYGTFTEAEKNFNQSNWKVNADGQKYQNTTTGQWITKKEFEALRKRNQEYQKMLSSDTYKEYQKLQDELVALQNSKEGKAWLNPDLTLKDGVDEAFEARINGLKDQIAELAEEIDTELTVDVELELQLQNFDEGVDKIQDVYSTLKGITTEYNKQGYLSLDNLQALLSLSPEYLAVLQMEGGQLTINQAALEAMLQTKLADAEATAVQTAITQLNALAERKKAIEVSNSAVAANQATIELGTYSGALSTVASDAIIAAGSVAAFNAALKGAQDNEFVSDEEWQQVLTNFQNTVGLIDSVRSNLPTSFNNILDPGSKTSDEEVKDDRFQKEMDYWENRIAANQAKYEQLQNEIDLLEAKGQKADASFYKEQINLENDRLWLLGEQKKAAEARLKAIEDAGGEGSEEWWEAANTLNGIESDIDDVTASIVDLQDAMGEIDAYKFEEFNNRLDNLTSKLGTIRDLIAPNGEEDWFDDEGNWTEKGIAYLASYVQDLEFFKQGLAEAETAYKNFAYLTDENGNFLTNENGDLIARAYDGNEEWYANNYGIHSEQEYYDKTEELISQQYDFAESISDTEQSIVDMYESNIDAVEEYVDTLIDGYNDYIDSVKEALDAERDLYDFKKNVQKQAKDIAEIERRIASLSGSTNKADIAERRKLEAQLYESRESLDDTYYDHAKDSQNEALDAEASAYEKTMTKMVEGMRTSLEEATANMDTFLNRVTIAVSMNAEDVLAKYRETELPLDDAITNPWENAKKAVGEYGGDATNLMDVWKKDGYFAEFKSTASTNLSSPWSTGTTAANTFKNSVSTVMSNVVSNIATNVKTASGELSKLYQQIITTEQRAASANVSTGSGGGSSGGGGGGSTQKTGFQQAGTVAIATTFRTWESGKQTDNYVTTVQGQQYLYVPSRGMYYPVAGKNPFNYKDDKGKRDAGYSFPKGTPVYKYYAKGTTGTARDEWAITDESRFGDELVLVPGKDGNLSFMRKGTGVVPADLTANLMEWGQFTPDSMNLGGGVNVNMINNAVNKPEFNFSFDALVKAERIDENTLPEVKKFVQQEINSLVKQMNYAIKGKGGR